MNDGIVQKVFNELNRKINNELLTNGFDTGNLEFKGKKDIVVSLTEVNMHIRDSLQELIEEIKKLFPDSPFRHSNAFIISRLIGDNEK